MILSLNVIHFKNTSYQEVLVLAIIFSLSNNFFVEDFIIRLVIFIIWTNKNYQDIDRDSCRNVRRVWRYQRGNQNLYIEEEQTTQWPKEKVQTTIFSFMCMFCRSLFVLFLLTTLLYVLLRSLVICVCFVDRCLSFSPFSSGHCVAGPSSILITLWYLHSFYVKI